MKPDPNPAWDDSADDDDDIEILEVVGMEEDSPGASPASEEPVFEDEMILEFDESSLGEEDYEAAPNDEMPKDFEETRDRLVRLQADFENLQKRSEREREEYREQANAGLIGRLLPILDNFERALETPGPDGVLREGVILIFRQLVDELRKEGLEPIESSGERFDPNLHEAIESDRPGYEVYRVVEELVRGYRLRGRLLRPSLVKVEADTSDDESSPDE